MRARDIAFFGYNLKNTNWRQLFNHCQVSREESKRSVIALLGDCFVSSLKYEITPTEFFLFGFADMKDVERRTWAGTTYMYKSQLRLNPRHVRPSFIDKALFRARFSKLMHPAGIVVRAADETSTLTAWFQRLGTGQFVAKPVDGQCGKGVCFHSVRVRRTEDIIIDEKISLGDFLQQSRMPVLLEQRLYNHGSIEEVAPNALNTLRVITFLRCDGSVEIVAARMRFSRGGTVDNLASGGIAAPVDASNGVVSGPAIGMCPDDRSDYETHPVTGQQIVGLQLPYWDEVVAMTYEAARVMPEARSIGWDIAITPEGPYLIEGNHNWGKTLWQLPVRRGLRSEMERLLSQL